MIAKIPLLFLLSLTTVSSRCAHRALWRHTVDRVRHMSSDRPRGKRAYAKGLIILRHDDPQPDGLPSLRILQPDPERDCRRVPGARRFRADLCRHAAAAKKAGRGVCVRIEQVERTSALRVR